MAVKLNPASLDWALNHVEKFGDTDIFPPAFEFKVIREFWNALPAGGPKQRVRFREFLATLDLLSWTMRPPRRCLSPKHQFGFRASTQLDPLDAILFTALVYEIGIDLESTRVPSDEAVVHSYRFSTTPDGQMFDPEFSYGSFCERSVELAYELDNDFVVVADIADFIPVSIPIR